jgi:DNA-binding IclR family transcriptional regulator
VSAEQGIIHSIDRALDILLLLRREGREMGVTQISSQLGMYKSTVYRTLDTLERKGFVQQNTENGKYWLGIQLYSLGMLVREKLSLATVIYPYAKALADKFQEVIHISVLDKSAQDYPKHIIIDKVGQKMLSLTPPVGSISPCHCSAVGKCLLAFAPHGYLAGFTGKPLPGYTPKTITGWDGLLAELARIRAQGYAIDNEELETGLTCVAGPIFGRGEEALAALSLSGPTSRISERFDAIVAEVLKTVRQISASMQ